MFSRLTLLIKNIPLNVFVDDSNNKHNRYLVPSCIGRDTHRQLLSLIYGLKYLHHDDYNLLPGDVTIYYHMPLLFIIRCR